MAKRAVLIGVADSRPYCRLRPRPSVAVMERLLEDLTGWNTSVLEGLAATRDGISSALRRLKSDVAPDDDVLLYFFGHGGVVRFEGPPPLGARPFFYISAARDDPKALLTGVFDFELSSILAEIDRNCGNVSVIVDCCHAANIVRSAIPRIAAPAWLEALVPSITPADELLAEEGHPRIVRLAGTSSLRSGFALQRDDGDLGLLTQGFVDVVREAELQLDRLTWDAVAHRVREHAIAARGAEIQWVTLAGPRQRLVFSRESVELPRSVGFVRGDGSEGGWLRAGLMQGVEAGDLWDIAAIRLGSECKPVVVARARVVEVGLNRSRVELAESNELLPAGGSSALSTSVRSKAAVAIDDAPDSLVAAIGRSGLLRRAHRDEPGPLARVAMADRTMAVSREWSEPLTMHVGDVDEAVELLEDWSRAERLLRLVERMAGDPPLRVAWGRYEVLEDGRGHVQCPLALDGTAQVHVGDSVYFTVTHDRPHPESWFVCAVEVSVTGRPLLLNTNEPDGVEIERWGSVCIGCRAAADRVGLRLEWPRELAADGPRAATVLFLASQRPIQLGHLVRLPDRNAHLLETLPRRSSVPIRGTRAESIPRGPTLSLGSGVKALRYMLVPKPR